MPQPDGSSHCGGLPCCYGYGMQRPSSVYLVLPLGNRCCYPPVLPPPPVPLPYLFPYLPACAHAQPRPDTPTPCSCLTSPDGQTIGWHAPHIAGRRLDVGRGRAGWDVLYPPPPAVTTYQLPLTQNVPHYVSVTTWTPDVLHPPDPPPATARMITAYGLPVYYLPQICLTFTCTLGFLGGRCIPLCLGIPPC